jgi:transcriptional regulator with XRE-family HTH domain
MTFGEKVRKLRENAGYPQRKVAEYIGISTRAYQSYEENNVIPKKRDVLIKLSELYSVSIDQLLSDQELFFVDISEQYGGRGAQQAQRILGDAQAYLAGGDITDEEREEFMGSLMRMFQRSKEIAQEKYGSKEQIKDKPE